jgi:hypothetical protein
MDLFTSTKVRNTILFFVTQYLPTLELEIFVGEYSLTQESGIL